MFKNYRKLAILAVTAFVIGVAYAIAPVATAAVLPGLFEPHALMLGAVPAFAVLGETVLDVFSQNNFGYVALTDAINKMPFTPSRAGTVIDWNEEGIPVTTVEFEQVGNTLRLVNPTPRGGPGETREKVKRTADVMKVPHYEINGGINADEVLGVRAFGSAQMMVAQNAVDTQQRQHAQDLDATLEYQRLGAIKGIVVNADGTPYVNLFTKFDVTPQAEVDFNLTSVADDGALLTTCTQIVRSIGRALGLQPFTGVYAFCSDTYWDALLANTERRKTYQAQNAAQLRDGSAWGTYSFGGVTFENYRGGVGDEEAGSPTFIEADKAYFFPVGVPRLFRTVYAPADYWDTANQTPIGLPRYSRQYVWQNGKGVALDTQMNALSYCTRPRALVKGKLT